MDRPTSFWLPSANFTPHDVGRQISCIILHATATIGKESPLNWLRSPESKVSAHYLIDELGMIFGLVDESNIAWHAGKSEWDNRQNVNNFSIGIELVNPNDGKTEYPFAQLNACADLVAPICKDHNIPIKAVVGHVDIAPGRKNDPLGFPWDQFRGMLIDRGLAPSKDVA